MTFQSPPLSLGQLTKVYLNSPQYNFAEEDRELLNGLNKTQTMIDAVGFTSVTFTILLDLYFTSNKYAHLKGFNKLFARFPHLLFHLANISIVFAVRTHWSQQAFIRAASVVAKYDPEAAILKYRDHLMYFRNM